MTKEDQITIFTDGSSRGNPGPGGWAAVVVNGGKVTELGGREEKTTNNIMEMTAALEALKKTPKEAEITLYTDSSYLVNGITKWVKGWKKNGWKTKTKGDVLNRDIWEKLHELTETRQVKWKNVGGHVGVLGNERCDYIATSFADNEPISLYKGALIDYDLPGIMDISHDELKATAKKSDSSHSRAKAYSYVSMVGGVIETHHTWAECEKRVKGVAGAKYRKSISLEDELQITEEFGTF